MRYSILEYELSFLFWAATTIMVLALAIVSYGSPIYGLFCFLSGVGVVFVAASYGCLQEARKQNTQRRD